MGSERGTTTTVRIAELKNRLSYCLRRVQRGESILVCDRDRVIARIERVTADAPRSKNDAESLDRLERGQPSRQWLAREPALGTDAVAALLRERDEAP